MTELRPEQPVSGRRRSSNKAGAAPDHRLRRQPDRQILHTLRTAEIVDCQLVPWGSNYTFAVALDSGNAEPTVAIYKPSSGEIPLWDFDSGTLYRREYASYLLSRSLGWHFIPATVIRQGPHGIGTVQRYVEPRQSTSERELRRDFEYELRTIFLFDLLSNNADRKGSHFFVGSQDGRLWGIDHGLTFHVAPKVRTVIWDFCGEPLDSEHLAALDRLARHRRFVSRLLNPYLEREEVERLFVRAATIREAGTFPLLNPRRNIPYGW